MHYTLHGTLCAVLMALSVQRQTVPPHNQTDRPVSIVGDRLALCSHTRWSELLVSAIGSLSLSRLASLPAEHPVTSTVSTWSDLRLRLRSRHTCETMFALPPLSFAVRRRALRCVRCAACSALHAIRTVATYAACCAIAAAGSCRECLGEHVDRTAHDLVVVWWAALGALPTKRRFALCCGRGMRSALSQPALPR